MKITEITAITLRAPVTRVGIATCANPARIRDGHFVAPETLGAGMEPSADTLSKINLA
jgi:hypothetical protein